MSGRRTVTVAPCRLATGTTLSVSPTGAGSPLGWWVAPGGGWVNIFGPSGTIHLSAGQPSSASPYRAPDAAWSTGFSGAATSTASTIGARAAGPAAAAGPGWPTTPAATVASTVVAAAAARARYRTVHLTVRRRQLQ